MKWVLVHVPSADETHQILDYTRSEKTYTKVLARAMSAYGAFKNLQFILAFL